MTLLLVALGGAAGAVARSLADTAVTRATRSRLPLGILLVNVAGAFVLGALVAARPGPAWLALLGTGFCGALTTYSTFALDTARLARGGHRGAALANALGSLALGLAAAAAGYALFS